MDNPRKTRELYWSIIDHIRKIAEPEDYIYKVLGIIFLRYLSDSQTLPLSEKARWSFIEQNSKNPEIGSIIEEAMKEVQYHKPSWKGCLPDGYTDKNVKPEQISELIESISCVDPTKTDKQIWVELFEYIFGMFPREVEKNAGEFYSPRRIMELMVRTLAPENGTIYDPCCGSGGMFIEANKYINEQQDINAKNVKFYGQEQSLDTVKISTMHLAMLDIDAKISIGDTFENDNLPEVKADYILANPPFNIKWSSKDLKHDKRWMYGVPSDRNANYVWLQQCLFKLSPNGKAVIILPNGSLNSKSKNEIDIRRKMIEAGNIACIMALPSNLFYNTNIPVSLWILTKNKKRDHILFINAAELELPSTKHGRELPPEIVEMISAIYHKWENGNYKNIPGLCKSTPIEEVAANSYSLVSSLYVNNIENEEDTVSFDEKISFLNDELSQQSARANELKSSDAKIRNNIQMNRTLNEMVHTVFKEWFVHFRAPNLSIKRKKSDLGTIPEDWQVMPLKEFSDLQMGYSFQKKDFKKDGEIGVIKIKNIRENFIDVSPTDFVDSTIIESIDRKYRVESNSLLIAMSGSDAGKIGLVPPLNQSKELWLNQRVGMFKEKFRYGNFFLHLLLSTPTYQTILRNSAIGSAQPNISVTFLNEMRIIVPPAHLIEQFGKEMYPMFEQILANNKENKKLEITYGDLFA